MRMKQEKLQQGLTLALLGLVGLGLAVWAWLRPADTLSISERRKLAQKPALSVQSVQSGQWMQKFESYSLDQFPLRDTLRGLKAAVQLGVFCQKDNNGVYLQNGYASKLDYPLHTDSVERAADKFLQLQKTYLEGKAGHVYGVEIVPQAIADAKDNAKRNGFSNTGFFIGKAEEVLPEFYAEHKNEKTDMLHPDVIVVDPPRKGCEESLLQTIVDMQPEKVVYVSCDSATLARDVKFLRANGYELKDVTPVDQFPHTVHVEVVCCLHRVNS